MRNRRPKFEFQWILLSLENRCFIVI